MEKAFLKSKIIVTFSTGLLVTVIAVPPAHAQNYNNPFPTEVPQIPQSQLDDCSHNPRTCRVPDGIATGADPKQQDAWNKCLVTAGLSGIPAAKAAKTIWTAVRNGTGLATGAAYAGCDWDFIKGEK